ncbi:MAG: TonB-dependent receptor [Caulobacteraceae bacterium]|nr:MAG: TonB-dependent receptor [Caulobacteraceae bacterium]
MLDRKRLLATTVLAGFVAMVAAPAVSWAQDTTTPPPAAEEEEGTVEELVVTGSRIKRTEFTSAAPVQVITSDSATLEGLIDPAQILQNSSVATGSTQINNQFTGFVINGGGGVNTVSLRGLGDNRTLVLMNGRRLPPAGTQGAVGAVDLNMLPGTAIQRYEILKDGASSIYGSDAIAGVVNVITRTDLDGWLLQASGDATIDGGGEQVSFGAAYGKVFDKGHFMVSAEYFEQKALKAGDRDEFMCQQAYLRNPNTGARNDWYDVDTGKFKCYGPAGVLWGYVPLYLSTGAFRGSRASIATEGPAFGADPAGRWGASAIDPLIPGYRFAQLQERNSVHPLEENIDIFSPVERFTVFADGAYDFGFAEAYGEFLFHNRKSSQYSIQQMFPIIAPEAPCSVNVFNCAGVSTLGPDNQAFAPQALVLSPYGFEQDVTVYRLLGGLRGDFGGSWSWDGYMSYSKNEGDYTQIGINAEKLLAGIGGDWATSDFSGICPVGSPAGCRPLALVSNDYLARGTWSADDYDWLRLASNGSTEYTQFIAEFQVTGDLFNLPAGPLGSAFGVSYRRDELDDQPGADMKSGNFYNLATAGVTKGEDNLWEVYGELEAPLVRGVPGIEALTLNLSGRYSDYETYGSNSTYRASLNWTINSQFRIRGTIGTSFRAPALFELNLGDQGGFLSQGTVDPCINYNDPQKNVSDQIKANCLAAGIPGDYTGLGSSAFLVTGGGENLKAEESKASTLGIIWTPDFIDLNVAVDYFDILVDNQVTSNGAAVVGRCYSSANFPNDPFCSLFTRDTDPNSSTFRNITEIDASYRNIVSQSNRGVDLTVRYTQDIGPGRLTLDTQFTWTLEDTQELFPGSVDDFNGVIGEPSVTGSNQLRYRVGEWTVGWTSRFVGHQGNYNYQFGSDTAASNFTTPTGAVAEFKNHAEATWWHDLAIQYDGDTWGATLGVANIFGEEAPNVSDPITPDRGNYTYGRLGTYAFATQYYDLYRGRSVFLNVSKRF